MEHQTIIPHDPRVRNFRPYPSGTATEDERVIFIARLVKESKIMLAQGGKKACSPVRLLLRQSIFCFWESREFHKFDPRRPRSLQALADPSQAVSYDHVVPRSVVAEWLLESEAEPDIVRNILNEWVFACVITKVEDRRLDGLGLRQQMPVSWDKTDRFARYRMAGIHIPGVC
jgi:hypothetical protein